MSLALQISIAKAKVAARKKREKLQAEEANKTKDLEKAMLIEQVLKSIEAPKDGIDGRDAPTLDEILGEVKSLLPEPEIRYIEHKTDLSEVKDLVNSLFEKKLPEIQKEDRPKTEIIREEVDLDCLDDYVTKADLDDALLRVQRAIEASQGGGGGVMELTNVIEVSSSTTIREGQLIPNQINIILVMTAGIEVTLPEADVTKIVWVQQGYTGTGTFTVCKESS